MEDEDSLIFKDDEQSQSGIEILSQNSNNKVLIENN